MSRTPQFLPPPFTPYETPLQPHEEQAFQAWKQVFAPHDSGEDYDLRGAFKAGVTPDPRTNHWPDTFKKPNEPTFSVESQYAPLAPDKAGQWVGPNHDIYVPAKPIPDPIQMHQGTGWAGLKEAAADAGDLLLNAAGAKAENQPIDVNIGAKGTTPLFMPKSDVVKDVGIPWGPDGFYSHAENVLNEAKQGLFTGDQLLGYLKGKGVKDEEIKWSGLGDLVKNKKVSREEALQVLQKAPRISETMLGEVDGRKIAAAEQEANDAYNAWHKAETEANDKYYDLPLDKWPKEVTDNINQLYQQQRDAYDNVQKLGDVRAAKYTVGAGYEGWHLPGPQENYKEILLHHSHPLTVNAEDARPGGLGTHRMTKEWKFLVNGEYRSAFGDTPEEAAADLNKYLSQRYVKKPLFNGAHHDEDDVLGHLRLNDRRTIARDKVGHIEEVQSDWQNAGVKLQKDDQGNPIPGSNSWKDPVAQKQHEQLSKQIETNANVIDMIHRKLQEGYPIGDRTKLSSMSNENWQERNNYTHKLTDLITENQNLADKKNKIKLGSVNPAPHVQTGDPQELLLKKALMEHAKDPDKKWITMTTGKQQVDRSTDELRANVDKIEWNHVSPEEVPREYGGPIPSGGVHIRGYKGGAKVVDKVIPKAGSIKIGGRHVDLDNIINKEWGQKFREVPRGSIQGEGLQLGGSGKIHSYDVGNKGKIDRLLKTKGTKIDIEHLPGTGGQTVHAWPLNEKTRAIIAKGFPLYSVAPLAMLPSHKPTAKPLPPPPSIKH